jgi:hypothetical protein
VLKSPLFLLLPIAALAACGEEPAPEPAPAEVATPEPIQTAPAPDEALFAELFAAACPNAEPVSTSFCQRALGANTVSCEFGLGDDEALRHDATLELDETGLAWSLVDPETVCAQ